MKLLFALLAATAALILWICRAGKGRRLSQQGRINIRILVKDQEEWMEGFVRKLYRVIKDSDRLEVCLVDDGSRDRTTDILKRLERVYPLRTLSVEEDNKTNSSVPVSEFESAVVMRFDVRGLKGRELLNSPLFCHLSHLNAGKSQVLSK